MYSINDQGVVVLSPALLKEHCFVVTLKLIYGGWYSHGVWMLPGSTRNATAAHFLGRKQKCWLHFRGVYHSSPAKNGQIVVISSMLNIWTVGMSNLPLVSAIIIVSGRKHAGLRDRSATCSRLCSRSIARTTSKSTFWIGQPAGNSWPL